jgi:hypothetical protein
MEDSGTAIAFACSVLPICRPREAGLACFRGNGESVARQLDRTEVRHFGRERVGTRKQPLSVQTHPITVSGGDRGRGQPHRLRIAVLNPRLGTSIDERQACQFPPLARDAIAALAVVDQVQIGCHSRDPGRNRDRQGVGGRAGRPDRELTRNGPLEIVARQIAVDPWIAWRALIGGQVGRERDCWSTRNSDLGACPDRLRLQGSLLIIRGGNVLVVDCPGDRGAVEGRQEGPDVQARQEIGRWQGAGLRGYRVRRRAVAACRPAVAKDRDVLAVAQVRDLIDLQVDVAANLVDGRL